MREHIEDVFLKWQTELDPDNQDRVVYCEYDARLQTVFVYRHDSFDKEKLGVLERLLQEEVSASVLVSSLVDISVGLNPLTRV